jgi:DtxR family manganese transport transcriptional regulator
LIKIGVDAEVANNDAEGLEHHVSSETLKVFEKFVKK